MAKRASNAKPADGKKSSFSELNDMLSKFSPDGAIIDDSLYAKIDEWIPTGYYILNAALSGSLFGGLPNRRSLMFAGAEGTGKTFIACSIVRNAQAMDYFPIYFDSEGSIDVDFVKRLGVDTSKFRIENIGTVEEFTNLAANIIETLKKLKDDGKTPPKIIIVLDSLGSLSSTKEKNDAVSGSDKRDMTKQQAIRKTFRVLGNDFAKYGIPFIVNNHVYAAIGSFVGGDVISGGGGGKYSPSIIFTLTKSSYGDTTDKVSEGQVKKLGLEKAKVGITITLWPYKQRFARPIPVKIYIPFYKKPNPYVGLERFITWESCGIVRGNVLSEKEFNKLPATEQKYCYAFKNAEGVTVYARPKDTSRNLVCKHLGGEVPLAELYTEKVFTEEVLHQLDENVIKSTFMLPSIESLEDLAEVSTFIDDAKEDVETPEDTDLLNELDEITDPQD
jgi:RecA/RadA recombinase